MAKEAPGAYKVLTISMYLEDLKNLDVKVEALKARGLRSANRSMLIRYALSGITVDQVLEEFPPRFLGPKKET